MKKIIFTLISILLFTNHFYAQKIKQGKMQHPVLGEVYLKKVYDDGYYFFEGKGTYTSSNNIAIAYEITFHPNGVLAFLQEKYKDPKLGEVIINRGARDKSKSYKDKDGLKTRHTVTYFTNDTLQPHQIYTYKDGNKEGKHLTYYANGNLKKLENYNKGWLKGLQENYYENGQLKDTKNYGPREKLNGSFKIYKENGELAFDGNFINNKRIGSWEMKRFSDDRFFEFKAKCLYEEDSVYCEEKEYYVNGNNNDLRSIRNFKKVNEYKSYLKYNDYDEFDQINHGAYKEMFSGFPLKEGTYYNGEKEGIWKTYHNNGKLKFENNFIVVKQKFSNNFKSLSHGFHYHYEKETGVKSISKYYKGKEVLYEELNWTTIVGGMCICALIFILIAFKEKFHNASSEYVLRFSVKNIILTSIAFIILLTSIPFLTRNHVEYYPDFIEVVFFVGISIFIGLIIFFSMEKKPPLTKILLGFLIFFFIWLLPLFISIYISDFLIYFISLLPAIYNGQLIIFSTVNCIVFISGIIFFTKFWKIKSEINYLYFFLISLFINLSMAVFFIIFFGRDEIPYGDLELIIFIINSLLTMALLSKSAINDFKYIKKINNPFITFLACIIPFVLLFSLYKYIDPFESDCEKVLEMDNYMEKIEEDLEEGIFKLHKKYGSSSSLESTYSLGYDYKKELNLYDKKITYLNGVIRDDYKEALETEVIDCNEVVAQHKERRSFATQRATKILELYETALQKEFEENEIKKKTP